MTHPPEYDVERRCAMCGRYHPTVSAGSQVCVPCANERAQERMEHEARWDSPRGWDWLTGRDPMVDARRRAGL